MVVARIEELLQKFIADRIVPEELAELQQLVQEEAHSAAIDSFLLKAYGNKDLAAPGDEGSEQSFDEIKARILAPSEKNIPVKELRAHRVNYWWAAAAAVPLILVGWYFFVQPGQPRKNTKDLAVMNKEITAPATNRATLTLEDGTVMYLDSLNNGQMATEGNVRLVKLANGKIAYELLDTVAAALTTAKNTVSNPKGSQAINITLSDGSRVWLNSGSSITYPVLFMGADRPVTLQGEGYFEVSPVVGPGGVLEKFVVTSGATKTEVTGTHFNISAYTDEAEVKVTLLEGKVEVLSGSNKLRLAPSQQAKVQNGAIALNKNVNIDEVMAWKNGSFYFDKANIGEVVRQLARWYDLEFEFQGKIPNRVFEGEIQRDLTLSQALRILENNKVNFKLEGRKIIIMP